MKVELKEQNFGKYDIKKTVTYDSRDDADIITYVAQNIPAMTQEENSPGPTYLYPHIMVLCKSAVVNNQNFTYFATVDNQYSWYRDLVKSLNNDNSVISAKAKELTTGLTNDMDKIKAIFYYVQNNVRYIAFENGIAGFKPEKADEVLRKKYGDCKGMANLTKSLLTSLGYDARLCWLGTNHIAYDYQTPSLAVDNHMICALNFKGKMIYLDATETYLGINEYAERIQGRQVLIENGDKYILSRVPVAAATQNYDYEISKLTIDGSSLTGSINHLWKGEDKESVLSGLNSIKKERADEAIVKYLSNDNNDYKITDLKLSSTDNPDKDLTAVYNVNNKNAVTSFSKSYYVDLDFRKELINSAIKISDRKHDFWFDYRINLCKETELAIPANYKVANLPAALNIVNPDYEFHIKYEAQPGKLTYKKTILVKNTHLTVSKFAQWNRDIELLGKAYNETVTLKPISE
ncbi:MAG: transglutaminase-like domain-containing protein, partial [Mucilaginibacter sp.]